MTSSDSLVGVNKTTFDNVSLAIGRRDIPERTEPREAATGGVDLTDSVGLVGVDKTIFEDQFLTIGLHDTSDRAGPSEAAAGERVNKLQSVPTGVRLSRNSCYA